MKIKEDNLKKTINKAPYVEKFKWEVLPGCSTN